MKHLSIIILFFSVGFCQEIIGDFTYDESIDPITDEVERIAYITDSLGENYFSFTCFEEELAIIINFDGYIGNSQTVTVITRFDQKEPLSLPWNLSESGTELYILWGEKNKRLLFQEALDTEKLALRFDTYNDEVITLLFETEGLREVAQKLPCTTTMFE
jgi:hypothetical protein